MIKKMLARMFYNSVAKRRRAKLRSMMRGYRILRKQYKLSEIQELKAVLTSYKLPQVSKHASRFMFGASICNAELIVRQYLHVKLLLGPRFNKAILYSIGANRPVTYPLSLSWQNILKENGYHVNFLISYLLWITFLFASFLFGVYRALSVIKQFIICKISSVSIDVAPAAYFNNMQPINLPPPGNEDTQNIFSWYAQWSGRDGNVQHFYHDIKGVEDSSLGKFNICSRSLTQLSLENVKPVSLFMGWLFVAIIVCIKDIILLRWFTPLLFEQFVVAAVMRFADDKCIANDYLFHNSCWVYRPIWTYELEKRNSRIILYFYSTNVEALKTAEGYPAVMNGWDLSTWPYVLVWDEYQANFVRRSFSSVGKVDIVGQIWFSSARSSLPLGSKFSDKRKAAVFDVQPHRSSSYQMLGIITEYYSSEVAIQFLKDTYQVLREKDVIVLHKRKREIGNVLHPRYINTIKSLEEDNQFSVDPGLSANCIIDESDIVISMPFTSTALLGRVQGKPSIYYDPFGDIQRDDRGAHDIPIVIGVEQLREWVNGLN